MAGERRLIEDEHDRAAGVETWHTYDPVTRETTIEVVQDAAPYLALNAEQRKNRQASSERKQNLKGFVHAARIPMGVQYHWLQHYGVNIHNPDHGDKVKKLLNSPEWRYLKTTERTL